MKTKRLNDNSMATVLEIIDQIWDRRIDQFDTQSLLYRFIEDIKFPHLKRTRARQSDYISNVGHGRDNPYERKPYYMPCNYQPIVNWLMHNEILSKRQSMGRVNVIEYMVDRERIMEIPNFRNTYNI